MDLNAIRSKLNSLQQQNKGNGGSDRSLFWKPSIGKQVVSIVPNKFNKSNPFTEVYFHYGIGERVMISPINYGEKDPIVEFASNSALLVIRKIGVWLKSSTQKCVYLLPLLFAVKKAME